MTKTELLAEILGEAREFESNDGMTHTETKQAIAAGLYRDMQKLGKTLNSVVRNDQEITPGVRRSLVQAAGAIVALLTDDLTADKPEPELTFP